MEIELTLAEEPSTAILSSSFNNAFSGLTVVGLEVIRSSICDVASNGGLVDRKVLVGGVSPLPTTVFEVGERLMVQLILNMYFWNETKARCN